MDNNTIEMLKQYKQLLDEEIITQEEFDLKKKELLGTVGQTTSDASQQFQQAPSFTAASQSAQNNQFTQSTTSQNTQGLPYDQYPQVPQSEDSGSMGWGVLGFFFPLVGLILFLVWQNTRPKDSKIAGKGALIGVIVGVVAGIIFGCVGAASMSYYY